MYPDRLFQKPLSHIAFYVLLSLSHSDSYVYALRAAVENSSLGSISIGSGQLYPVLKNLMQDGLIAEIGPWPTTKTGQLATHYAITRAGHARLRNEFKRLTHAMAIGEARGYLKKTLPGQIPDDIQDIVDRAISH